MAQGRYLSWHPYGVHPLRAKRSGDPRMVSDDVCDENELFREVSQIGRASCRERV